MFVLVWVLQRNSTDFLYKKIYYKVLAHIIMEAEISQTKDSRKQWCSSEAQQPDSWWSKCQAESEGLRIKSAKGRIKSRSQLNTQAEMISTSHCLLVLFRSSIDWIMSTHFGKGQLLYSAHQLKSLPETASQILPQIMFNQISGYLMAHSTHKINHHCVFQPFSLWWTLHSNISLSIQ